MDGGINTYGYVGQNPVAFADPLGLRPVPGNVNLSTKCRLQCGDDFLILVGSSFIVGVVTTAVGGSGILIYYGNALTKAVAVTALG